MEPAPKAAAAEWQLGSYIGILSKGLGLRVIGNIFGVIQYRDNRESNGKEHGT